MSEVATAADLFGGPPKRRFTITDPLPVKGVRVRLRSITEKEYADFEMEVVGTNGQGLRKDRIRDATRRFIALCVVDGDGNAIVSSAQRGEIGNWDAADSAFLYDECVRHCGLRKNDIEGLVKNDEAKPAAT